MAAVDMRRVNFWLPPDFRPNTQRTVPQKHHRETSAAASARNQAAALFKNAGSRLQHSGKSKSAVVTQRHEFPTPPEGHGVNAQEIAARNHDCANHSSKEDYFPSVEELCQEEVWRRNQGTSQRLDGTSPDSRGCCEKQQRLESSVSESQGTQDSPVILEDDEMNIPSVEAAAMPAMVDVGIESTVEMKKPTGHVSQEAWYDIEYGCYVLEDCPSSLDEDGLTPMLAQDYRHSPGPSQDAANQYNDANTQRTSEEAGVDTCRQLVDRDGGQDCGENMSELERDILLAFKEQESLSSVAPSFPHLHCPSSELAHLQVDQKADQNGTSRVGSEEPRHISPFLCSQTQKEAGAEAEAEPLSPDQQPQEMGLDEVREVEDDSSKPEQAEQVEKRPYQEEREEGEGNIQPSESSGCSHNTSNEEDEEDEEPRPAKRRKRHARPTINALTSPPGPHSGSRLLGHSRSITPPTRLDIDHAQAHADGDNSPSPVDDEHPRVSRLSRSPSATGNSELAAEYQEWPFQGFLKCVRVGNETTYNLEFKLPCMSEWFGLPISDNTFSTISLQASARPRRRRKSSSHSKPRAAVLSTLTKRVPWKPEEDTKLLTMKNKGCSWEEIHAALPHRSKGTIQVRYSTKLKV